MDTATKTGIDTAKTASKRVVQKTAEATGDLIGNKIADEITSEGKTKKKKKKKKKNMKKFTFHQKKESKLLMTEYCFKHSIKMEYQKIKNLLDTASDKVLDLLRKNG